MKHEVGDMVRIKPIEWFKKITGGEVVLAYLSNFCGKVFTISAIKDDCYIIAGRPWLEEYVEPIIGEYNANFLENTAREFFKQLDGIRHDLFTNKAIIDSYMNKTCVIHPASSDTMQGAISIQRQIPKFKPAQKFKDGDILHCTRGGKSWTIIYKSEIYNGRLNYYCMLNACKEIILNASCDELGFRLATKEEKHTLFVEMLKQKMFWDAEHKQVQTINKGNVLYIETVDGGDFISPFKEVNDKYISSYYDYSFMSNIVYKSIGLCNLDDIKSIRLATMEENNMLSIKLFLQKNVVWSEEDMGYVTVKKGDILNISGFVLAMYSGKVEGPILLYSSKFVIKTKEFSYNEGRMFLNMMCGIRKGNLADQTEFFTRQREYFLKLQHDYKKGDILINPLTR